MLDCNEERLRRQSFARLGLARAKVFIRAVPSFASAIIEVVPDNGQSANAHLPAFVRRRHALATAGL